jgi:hypothetical protein
MQNAHVHSSHLQILRECSHADGSDHCPEISRLGSFGEVCGCVDLEHIPVRVRTHVLVS